MSQPRLLYMRFPRLRDLPLLRLSSLPSPVEPLTRSSAAVGVPLWVKNDGATSSRYGGSKVRKLEWLLGDARHRQFDSLVAVGALGSHFVAALGAHAVPNGFRVDAVLVPQPMTRYVEQQLAFMERTGVSLHRARNAIHAAAVVAGVSLRLRRALRRPLVLPPGGSNERGILGLVDAGLELAREVDEGVLPEPETIVCPAGSGGLAVGLAIGLAAAGLSTRVRAVRVGSQVPLLPPMLRRSVQQTIDLLHRVEPRFPQVARLAAAKIDVDSRFVGKGYGRDDPRLSSALAAAKRDGLRLEPTYTGKAFAAVLESARDGATGPVLFWCSSPRIVEGSAVMVAASPAASTSRDDPR